MSASYHRHQRRRGPARLRPGGNLATGLLARGRPVAGADAAPDVHLRTMRAPKIRILVAKPGLDGHDRGAKVVARALRDAGFEVVYTGLHQTPDMIAVAAIQEDVDAVGLSIMSGAHNTLFPAVLDALSSRGAKDIVVFGGGIVPEADAELLRASGVGAIFTPGAALDEIVDWIRINVKPRSFEA
jgi:methylmalonyl-CoA mutase, C-terminal domain